MAADRTRGRRAPAAKHAAVLTAALLIAGCGAGASPDGAAAPDVAPAATLSVYVVNYPLQYVAERIGGAAVAVIFPAPADGDPAFWEPGAAEIAGYQSADLILLNGANYARWVATATLPTSRLVDTGAAFADRTIEVEAAVTHSHGPEGEHSHGELAFTTWLDPTLVADQARAIRDAFAGARPQQAESFDRGLEALLADLDELDGALREATSAAAGQPLVASHPVYQYLARRYDLDLRSVHFEPDVAPDQRAWAGLEELLVDHPAALMLWEGEPLADTAARLEADGVRSVVFDPCPTVPPSGDWLSVMQANAEVLGAALSAAASQ